MDANVQQLKENNLHQIDIPNLIEERKVSGDYKSLLHKRSPPLWTNGKSRVYNPRRWVLPV
jgi:hypothetical protein